jgi:hypothetical protein
VFQSKALRILKQQIRRGEFDDDLDELINTLLHTVSRRRAAVRDDLLDQFTPGMRVLTLRGNYKPRYFADREGVITRIEDGTVWIQLDEPILRSRGTIQTIGMRGVEYLEIIES